LIEQHTHELFDDYLSPFNLTNGLLTSSIEGIDGELRQLKSDVQLLMARVDDIEKGQSHKKTVAITKLSKTKKKHKS
jgi:hypothetical protein